MLESQLREKVSENLDLMAKLSQANAQIMENQARESSAATIVEFGSSKGEKNEQRKSKISVSTPVTNTRSHKPSLDEWIELEQVRSELFSLETENRRLRRRAEVELANEV